MKLIQKTGLYQRADEGWTAVSQDVVSGLFPEPDGHEILPVDQGRVLLFQRIQAIGDHVLLLRVHKTSHRSVSLVRPEGGELFVGIRSKQKHIRLRHGQVYCLSYLLIQPWCIPLMRRLHHTINGGERSGDDFPHSFSPIYVCRTLNHAA